MRRQMRIARLTPLFIITALFFSPAAATVLGQDTKPLPIEDYARWRSITSVSISDNGQWVTFAYRPHRSNDTLMVQNLQTEKEYSIPQASGPQFSDDSQWIAYRLTVPFDEAEKLRGDNKPVPQKAELMNLETGEKRTWENAASFTFPKGSSHFLVRKTKPQGQEGFDGTDLILRNLNEGFEELLGSVGQYAFNKPGTVLAWTVDAADQTGNGVYIINLETGARRPLDNGTADYARMTWDEEGSALAALKGTEVDTLEQNENVLLAFTGITGRRMETLIYDPADDAAFPDSTVISDLTGLSWSEDLSMVFFGIKEQSVEVKKEKKPAALIPDVDIFHWQDEQIQTAQRVQANRERNRTRQAVLHLAGPKFLQLTDDEMRSISITRDGVWGIGENNRAYISDWKERQADYYRVNIETGERTLFLTGHKQTFGLSPDSEHFLYWQDGQIWDYVLDTGVKANLTASAPVSFANMEWDYIGERPAYGITGYSEDGRSVILTHRYDLYLQPLDGSPATNLTRGRGDQADMRLRYIRTDFEERFIDLKEPMLLSAYGQWTKEAGFFVLDGREIRELVYDDCIFSRPMKAEDADVFLVTRQTFRDFPDYYVTDGTFGSLERLTEANPQQAEYSWGRSILFDYTNNDGVRLQGWLGIPDGYQQGERLPMLVNFYEKNSQNLHRYQRPVYRSGPNLAGYVSNGYLAMQPDVHFRGGTSHSDMQECVEAAVRKVVEMGYADPDHVGLHGHSYSGGGGTFIATRSTMFAAITAGAAPIDLIFEFNILFTGSGQNNHQYDIHGQGRYGVSPYDDYELYESQSPIYKVQDMNTPLLYLHGGSDPTVEYLMGIELYNACRFLGKPMIFLSYPGEGHGLRRLGNQIDFQTRMRQFFNHHLKGEPAPDWMINGRTFIEKELELSRYESGGSGGGGGRGGRGGG